MADNEQGRDFPLADEPDSPDQNMKKAAHRKGVGRSSDNTNTDPGMEFDDNDIEERQ